MRSVHFAFLFRPGADRVSCSTVPQSIILCVEFRKGGKPFLYCSGCEFGYDLISALGPTLPAQEVQAHFLTLCVLLCRLHTLCT